MREIVDIYARVLIAVLGFVAPTVTLLMPILGDRIKVLKTQLEIRRRTLSEIISNNMSAYREALEKIPVNLRESLMTAIRNNEDFTNLEFRKSIKIVETQLRSLNLKVQVKRIFLFLALSIVFVMLYHAPALYSIVVYEAIIILECWYLLISLIFFILAIRLLWALIRIIIDLRSNSDLLDSSNIINNESAPPYTPEPTSRS